MKKLKRRLGQLYWLAVKKYHDRRYLRQKNNQRFRDWCRGFGKAATQTAPVDAHCIVVCAHPDDETLYFYSVLKEQNPFVICMSGTGSSIRSKEFYTALAAQGVHGMMLNMPDVPHMSWAWRCFGTGALKKAAKLCPAARRIYTHSATGESHHPHHYATHGAAVNAFSGCQILSTAPEAPTNGDGALSAEDINRKHTLLKTCYPSQIKMLETWYPWWDSYLKTEYFKE